MSETIRNEAAVNLLNTLHNVRVVPDNYFGPGLHEVASEDYLLVRRMEVKLVSPVKGDDDPVTGLARRPHVGQYVRSVLP